MGEPLIAYMAPSSVRLYFLQTPLFIMIASVDLPPDGGAQQQKQSTANIGTGRGPFKVVDHTRQWLVDAEQLALEQLPWGVRNPSPISPWAARPCQRNMSQMY